MAKLSQQFQSESPTRISRTERSIKKRELEKQKEKERIERAKAQADLDRRVAEQKAEKQKQDKQIDEIKFLIDKASKLQRGKPFALYGDPEDKRKLAIRFKDLSPDERIEFLKSRYPNIPESVYRNAVYSEASRSVERTPDVLGMDRGETRKFTTSDKEGVKSVVTYKKEPQLVNHLKIPMSRDIPPKTMIPTASLVMKFSGNAPSEATK